MCMKFNFISICIYLHGVCHTCCSFTNYSDPISLGTILYLSFVLGTLVMHWMLVSLIRKKWRPSDYWRRAMMLWQTHIYYITPLHPGNKYLSTSCILILYPTMWLSLAWIVVWKCCGLAKLLNETTLLQIWVSWDESIFWGI